MYSTNAFPKGLVNDATALVAFQVASGAALAGTAFALAPTALQVVYAPAASVAIGVAVGWIGRHILTVVGDQAVENTVMLLLPFGAFLPAETVHASGVLAVVTLALYLSPLQRSHRLLDQPAAGAGAVGDDRLPAQRAVVRARRPATPLTSPR